jgi:hypothetical protein
VIHPRPLAPPILIRASFSPTCAISGIRFQYLKLTDDVTWDNVASSCWSIGELCSGITCACLPTLRPLISKYLPGMRSETGPSNNKYYRRSSGRDVSDASRVKSTDETGSSRGIMYPEDLELQTDDRSDKDIRVTVNRLQQPHASHQQRHGRAMEKFRLGLKPTVQTEVKVGSPGLGPSSRWPAGDGIEVKTDFTMTTGR